MTCADFGKRDTAVVVICTLFRVNQEEYVFRNEYMMLSTADNGTWTTRDNFTDDRHALTVSSQFRQTYIIVYSLLIVSMIVAILVRSVVFVSVIMAVSTNLHRWMFNAIIGATMLFFNTNSSGNDNTYILLYELRSVYVRHFLSRSNIKPVFERHWNHRRLFAASLIGLFTSQ